MKDAEESVEGLKPDEIVKELQNIRFSIDRFLEKFERSLKLNKLQNQLDEGLKIYILK